MEEAGRRRRRKRRRGSPAPDGASFDRTVFPLLLAACASGERRNPHARCVLRRFLRGRLALLAGRTPSSSPPSLDYLLPVGLVSLLPLLLASRWPSVATLSGDVVGAAALHSLAANEILAMDGGVMKGLVRALGSKSRRVAKAACNAIMDLSTSPIGREQLCTTSAVESLLLTEQYEELFIVMQQSSHLPILIHAKVVEVRGTSIADQSQEKGTHKGESFLVLLLAAALILLNASTEEQLIRIPRELLERCLPLLREIMKKNRDSSLAQRYQHFTNYNLAKTIFRIFMNQSKPATWDFDKVRISIFGSVASDFENFMLAYWEKLPFLFSEVSKILEQNKSIFNLLINSFNPKSSDNVLDSILIDLVSCPPLTSDELDINCFLNDVNSSLGSPLLYGQDIRVLKAQRLTSDSFRNCVKKEVHLFENKSDIVFVDEDRVQTCKDAFQNGYTIAVRGMELRCAKIAAISEGLADLFGQPSVGANLYLTPPSSQGLACHYDDHCVFVWQLFGQKHWTISSSPTSILPRLYEPLSSLSSIESQPDGGLQMLLNEGDILYIPRGYAHEAHTNNEPCDSHNKISHQLSLHLTLAIEVQPPFEWEGFTHIALHCWYDKEKEELDPVTSSNARRTKVLAVLLLHVAIRLIANQNPIFRKACLVAAKLCPSNSNQKVTFSKIMDAINCGSNFAAAFDKAAVIQEENDDSLQLMRWLKHLPQHGNEDERIDFDDPPRMRDELVQLCSQGNEQIKHEFARSKSQFYNSVVYEDACEMFQMLLHKYRRTRKQYMNGMLTLHSAV